MRQYNTGATLLLATLLGIGCNPQAEWAGTVTDSAGVTIVSNPDQGIWTSSNEWTLDEELRIGALEGDPEYQFGQIGFIAVDSKDRIFVLDAQAQHIRVFSPSGVYEQTIGRPGSGPGELGPQAITLYIGPGDTLLVPDLGQQRVNRYAPDGTSLGSFRLSLEDGLPMAINATRTGVIAEQIRPLSLPNMPSSDSMDVIVTLATDGTITDTIMQFPSGGTIRTSGGGAPEIKVFSAEPVWRLTDDMRVLFGMSDEYRIGIYGPDGALQRVVSKSFTQRPITERDQEMMMAFFEEQVKDNPMIPPQAVPEAIARMRQMIRFADYYPAYAAVQVGPLGSLWVQHIQSPSELSEEELASWNFIEDIGSPGWDVFDREGRFLGVVRMPSRFAPRIMLNTKIYGVWRDELDVQHVMRLRIVGVGGDDTGAIPLEVTQ